ncbi:MAG: ATP-binding protein [Roseburia sp.]
MAELQKDNMTYDTTEDYFKELADWGKQWVQLYARAAVDVSPQGEIALIKGKALFKKELAELCQKQFEPMESDAYERERNALLEQMEQMHAKSASFIESGGMVTMEYLYRIFRFDAFEWYLFCMAFMIEIDQQFERVYCLLQDDFNKKTVTIDQCIRMYTLDERQRYRLQQQVLSHWEKLEHFFVVKQENGREMGGREGILSCALKIDERIVRFIYDMDSNDKVLEAAVICYLPSEELEPMLIYKDKLVCLEKMYRTAGEKGFLFLSGVRDSGKKFLIRHLCKKLKRPLLMVDATKFLELGEDLRRSVNRLAREAALKGDAVVCIAGVELNEEGKQEPESIDHNAAVEELLNCLKDTHLVPMFTSEQHWQESIRTGEMSCMELALELPDVEEREILWTHYLKKSGLQKKIDRGRLARTYQLPPGAIARVVQETELTMVLNGKEEQLEKRLYQGCQRQLVHSLGKDAVRVPAQYTMDDLVLQDSQKKLLLDACNMVEYHHQVFDSWGFDKKMAYGKGVSMIFYGPPGTGKTMGAQAIANRLNLELYRVDMASVLSKYVGESEKKLGNIFEQGAKSQSILFFDEADALFGKRSEVKDSQDKYANASTAFLLQKLEEYQGIIILATNLLQNFDQAFCRRFQFIVEFPFPDERRRLEIWQKVFPEELPKEELDYPYLAEEFVLSGSQIKNIAVGAAFLAAGDNSELKMIHILKTIKREMKKTGKNMIASDFGIYYSLMEKEENSIAIY